MAAAEQLITENLSIWSSGVQTKSAARRGKANKLELYGIKKLRELILGLAVRGLLVPQDPNDEPASKLLKKIAAERVQLVKDGKIKKPKTLSVIEDCEKQFEVPEGWEWARFGNAYWLEYGDNLPKAKRSGTGEYPVYGSNGVVGTHNDFCVESPCIVVGRKGSAGALNLCLDEHCWVTDVAYSLVPPSCMSIEFVFRQLHTLNLDSLGKGIKPGLSRNEAYVLPIAFPPVEEQNRIVAKIDELMALCDQLEQQQETSITAHQTLVQSLLDALTTTSKRDGFTAAWARVAKHFDALFTTEWSIDELTKTILQLAVMGKLVPQDPNDDPASELVRKGAAEKVRLVKEGKIKKQKPPVPIKPEEIPYEIPQGWSWARLPDVAFFQEGPGIMAKDFRDTGVPLIRISGMRNALVSLEGCNFLDEGMVDKKWSHFKLDLEDIVLSSSASLGKVSRAGEEVVGCIVYTGLIRFKPYVSLFEGYLTKFLESNEFLRQIDESKTGAAIKHFGPTHLKAMIIPIPSLPEQHRIVAKVDELMALCDTLQSHIGIAQATQLQLADAIPKQALR